MSEHWLESVSWAAQAGLVLTAIVAAVVALNQVRTTKLFELFKYLESIELRKSRRIVMREIYPQRTARWWEDKENGAMWESAASDVCASYDILGRLINYDKVELFWPSYGRFIQKTWGRSLSDMHDALEGFLKYRRERYVDSYANFSLLAKRAKAAEPHYKPPQSDPVKP